MATIVLTSASGAPGVTATALGLALNWPRPVLLVEADPTGASGIYAGYLRGTVEPAAGLIDLVLAHRRGALEETLPRAVRSWPTTSQVSLLAGIRAHDQARSLVGLWEPLAEVLRGLRRNGQDVIVDAGRLGLTGWPAPLVMGADLTLLATRNTLPALAGARSWATSLKTGFDNAGGADRFATLVVDESGRWPSATAGRPGVPRVRPYAERQVAKTLGLPVVATLPWAPDHADVLSHGAKPSRRWERSELARAYRACGEAVRTRLSNNEARLASTLPPALESAGVVMGGGA